MTDHDTTVAELRKRMAAFVQERDWEQFHDPKNLAASIAIEAAELMEHFQWVPSERSGAVRDDPVALGEVAEELADVFAYALSFANALDIDVTGALFAKLEKNAAKYPADSYYGRYE
ncbi:MAG: nucleotide pyrophosphohydrolase [bacterium]|nr:nucleotide pyrophosphohydrolase [bacterium]